MPDSSAKMRHACRSRGTVPLRRRRLVLRCVLFRLAHREDLHKVVVREVLAALADALTLTSLVAQLATQFSAVPGGLSASPRSHRSWSCPRRPPWNPR